jgi:hypothetical protein
MTDEETEETKPDETSTHDSSTQDKKKVKRHIEIPMVSKVDPSKIGEKPDLRIQRQYMPVDHGYQRQDRRISVPLMPMYIEAEPEPAPLMTFHAPPGMPRERIPRNLSKMPAKRMI